MKKSGRSSSGSNRRTTVVTEEVEEDSTSTYSQTSVKGRHVAQRGGCRSWERWQSVRDNVSLII